MTPSLFYEKPGIEDIVYGPYTKKERRVFIENTEKSLARNSYFNKKNQSKIDLNIFIVLKQRGDYYIDKRYKEFNDANTKFIAINNPLDNKIVFWSQVNPGERFIKVYNNLYRYLLSEIDRFYSGYELY